MGNVFLSGSGNGIYSVIETFENETAQTLERIIAEAQDALSQLDVIREIAQTCSQVKDDVLDIQNDVNAKYADIGELYTTARQELENIKTAALQALENKKDSALGNITTAETSALDNISALKTSTLGDITNAKEGATSEIVSAKNTALSDFNNSAQTIKDSTLTDISDAKNSALDDIDYSKNSALVEIDTSKDDVAEYVIGRIEYLRDSVLSIAQAVVDYVNRAKEAAEELAELFGNKNLQFKIVNTFTVQIPDEWIDEMSYKIGVQLKDADGNEILGDFISDESQTDARDVRWKNK